MGEVVLMVKEVEANDKERIINLVMRFMTNNEITVGEDIYQTDRVQENALDFISDLFDIVGVYLDV
jgi:hypothetical protein